jgi:hypothetical protein
MTSHFVKAERYIQLRKQCVPETWAKTINLISEMILMPLITLFFVFQMTASPMSILTTGMGAYNAWLRWIEYTELRFEMQNMYLHCMTVGGPFIVTNDPTYMPYVFADAAYRVPVGMAKSPAGGNLAA